MKKQGWKAVYVSGGRFYSLFMGPDVGGVEYCLGEETRRNPGHGPLTCFEEQSQAKYLAWKLFPRSTKISTAVFPCEYEKSSNSKIWAEGDFRIHREALPAGTILADSITIRRSL